MTPLIELVMQQIRVGDLDAAENAIGALDRGADIKTVASLKGRVALRRHDWTAAFDFFQIALAADPDSIDTLLLLGMATMEMGLFDEAADHFRAVIARDGWNAKAWQELGQCHSLQQHHAEAWACVERALGIAPDSAECHWHMGMICSMQGIDEGALHHFGRAHALQPDHAWAEAGLGVTLVRMGRWVDGWRHFEARWSISQPVAPWWFKGQPLYTGTLEGLRGQRVLLRSEQGYGDSIHFARYVEPLSRIASEIVVQVPPDLERLFACLPAEVIVLGRDEVPDFDHQTSLMSLPLLFGTTPETVPPPLAIRATPRYDMGTLGLCWAGGPRHEDPMAHAVDQRRSLRRAQFFPIMDAVDDQFVSLQREDLPPGDWQDTADLIAGLDLVITVDTAIAHLAASLGVPTWMLCRFDSCWRWGLTGETTPWYPSMTLYRQPRLGDWKPVIRRIVAELNGGGAAANVVQPISMEQPNDGH